MAMKDTKSGSSESDVIAGERTSPLKATVLGKKLQPISSASSPVTPMKLMPKLVSPQMKGGLIKVATGPRPAVSTALSGLSGPRPLISPTVRPGLVRNTLTSGPRPPLVSPRMPALGIHLS